MKKLKITKEAKALAKRPYTRVRLYKDGIYFGLVPEIGQRTHHKDPKQLDEQIDDLILTYIAACLEDGLSVPPPHQCNEDEYLLVDYENTKAYWARL